MKTSWKLISAHLLSLFGTKLHEIALPLLIYERTGSSALLSLAFFAETLPWVIVAPYLTSKFQGISSKRVLITADIVRALFCVLIAFVDLGHFAYLLSMFALGTFNSVYGAFRSKIVRNVMHDDAEIKSYFATLGSGSSIISVVAPAAGAILVTQAIPPQFILSLDALSFIFSLFFILSIREDSAQKIVATANTKKGFFSGDIKKVCYWLGGHKNMALLLQTECLRCMAEALIVPLFFVIITQKLHLGKDVYGWSHTAIALGAFVASIVFGKLNDTWLYRKVVLSVLALCFCFILLLYIPQQGVLLVVLFFIVGLAQSFRQLYAEYKFVANIPSEDSALFISFVNGCFSVFFLVGYVLSAAYAKSLDGLICVAGFLCFLAFALHLMYSFRERNDALAQ